MLDAVISNGRHRPSGTAIIAHSHSELIHQEVLPHPRSSVPTRPLKVLPSYVLFARGVTMMKITKHLSTASYDCMTNVNTPRDEHNARFSLLSFLAKPSKSTTQRLNSQEPSFHSISHSDVAILVSGSLTSLLMHSLNDISYLKTPNRAVHAAASEAGQM